MEPAEVHRLRAGDKDLFLTARAGGRREFAGVRIQLGGDDALGHLKLTRVLVGAQFVGGLHELGPDGQRGMCALEAEVGVVVEADPDDAQQIVGEAGEPAVVVGAGLAARGLGELMREASADPGSAVQHVLEHVGHNVGDARVHDADFFGRLPVQDVSVGVADFADEVGALHDAAVDEGRICAGDLKRRGFVGAERCCRRGLDVVADFRARRHVNDSVVADQLGDFDGGDVDGLAQRFA